MAEHTKVKTMTVRNVEVDIYVDTWGDRGNWLAYKAGQTDLSYSNRLGERSTLAELVKQLKQTLREKAATVRMPFEELNGRELREGIARGIHQRDNDVLVTWVATKEKDQLGRWGTKNILVPLTPETRAQIVEAAGIARDAALTAERAQKWLDTLMKPYQLDLYHAVTKAITERAKEMAVAEEPEKETA